LLEDAAREPVGGVNRCMQADELRSRAGEGNLRTCALAVASCRGIPPLSQWSENDAHKAVNG
jgi:hypothetical protein